MFPLSMSGQRDKFVSALGRVVSHVDQIENDATFLEHLGRDHRKYAVITEHYNAVGASLFATLKHFLGDDWNEELAADWAAAYQVIARIMVEAADTSTETSPDWWDADVVSVERRMMDLTLVRVQPRRELALPPRSVTVDGDPAAPTACGATSAPPTPHARTARSTCTCSRSTAARSARPLVRSLKVGRHGEARRAGRRPAHAQGTGPDRPAHGRRRHGSGAAPGRPRADRPRVAALRSRTAGPPAARRPDALAPATTAHCSASWRRAGPGSTTRRSSRTTRRTPARAARSARSRPGSTWAGARRWSAAVRRWSRTPWSS